MVIVMEKNIKKVRITILFITVALFVIVGSAVAAQKFSANRKSGTSC